MNETQCKQLLNSPKGLELVFNEVEKIKNTIKKEGDSNPNIYIRDNKYQISDIQLNGYTFSSRLNFTNTAESSYLLFAIFKGYYDENGKEDIMNPITKKEIIRLNFSFNKDCEFGWQNQENEDEFYKSEEITKIWIDKFFEEALEE